MYALAKGQFMSSSAIDLSGLPEAAAASAWHSSAEYWAGFDAATADLDPPFGVIHRGALAHNAHDLLRRAAGTSIRVASKSVRVRGVLDAVLKLPGYRGILAFTVSEALWLVGSGFDDVVVAYPSVDRQALRTLAHDEQAAAAITLMIDDPAHLDVVDSVAPRRSRATVRVALDLDASLITVQPDGRSKRSGVNRSPLHTPFELSEIARTVVSRPGFRLVGIMAYEAQVAGVIDDGPSADAVAEMKRLSIADLVERRGQAVACVRDIVQAEGYDLEFVNGGGTGSIESTRNDESVTEIAAGSGLFGPHLFDHYSTFTPAPAVAFALPVARKPAPNVATMLGGGWIASGAPGVDRLPLPVWPAGLGYTLNEAAGEVQTPLHGEAARKLSPGDRVWFRHTKAGELSEHVPVFNVIDGDGSAGVIGALPSYRGEGFCFL